MEKGLEALKEIRKATTHQIDDDCPYTYTVNYYEDEENLIEKELKALKHIKETLNLKVYKNKSGQCFLEGTNILIAINQEKYDLLKEVLL